MPARYRKRALAYEWSVDIKPKGRMKHHIEGQNRADAKEEIRDELHQEYNRGFTDEDDWWREELERAWQCHMYGICDSCHPEDDDVS